MSADSWKWLFCWEGRVTRRQYFAAGVLLMLLKYALDSTVARFFGREWHFWYYVLPPNQESLWRGHVSFYAVLWAIAIPFFWVGFTLTLRRLRDARQAAKWSFLFFLPLANFALFAGLSLLPSRPASQPNPVAASAAQSDVPVAIAVALTVVLATALVYISADVLMLYAWGLFLGVPFLIGFVSGWIFNLNTLHSRTQTTSVGCFTTAATGLALLFLRWEGAICLLMALPLAMPFAIAGSLFAWHMLRWRQRPPATTLAAWIFLLPLLMLGEQAAHLQPPLHPVVTSVVIDAPPAVVWKQVVAFSPLPPPGEWYFRAGIAYPTTAKIVGSGPGATRYCRFSTGDFVEPITVWDQDRLLAFNVSAEPPAMRELSPWQISPPHLEHNYFRSQRGQFRLVPLSGGRTLLEGTTWYQDYFWPQAYWQAWSDAIVHRIHLRVLRHVKAEAERQARQESSR